MTGILHKPPLPNWIDRESCTQRLFKAGENIFRQNEPTVGFYFILEGSAELRRVSLEGSNIVLHHAVAGEAFAEASLFSPTYHCDAVAYADTSTLFLRKDITLARLAKDSAFATSLLAHMARQVQHYRALQQLQAIRRADERVLAALQLGLSTNNWISFAGQIGLSHEAVYRALKVLTQQGKVQRLARGQYQLTIVEG